MHPTPTLAATIAAPPTPDAPDDGARFDAPVTDGDEGPLFVALVLAADGVLYAATAPSREASLRRVAEFVGSRLDTRLWPDDAAEVRALLADGRHGAAVSRYFDRVGRRWDEEWLVTARVGPGELAGSSADGR